MKTLKRILCVVFTSVIGLLFLTRYLIYGRNNSDNLTELTIRTRDNHAYILRRNDPSGQRNLRSPAINPHNYKFLINEANKCKTDDGRDRSIFLLVLVFSVQKNAGRRKMVRETWGSPTDIDGKKIVTMFLLADSIHQRVESAVQEESEKYHDLLIENFHDSYKNLTLKTIMGLKWASEFCPRAKYVMKTDDDMFVMYENIVTYLDSIPTPQTNFVSCIVIRGDPIRDPGNRWYMAKHIYPGSVYPPFCSGSGYVLSGDVAKKAYSVSLQTPFLHLEDVYFGICLFQLGVKPIRHRQFRNYPVEYSFCRFKHIFTTHYNRVSDEKKYEIWNDINMSHQRICLLNWRYWI